MIAVCCENLTKTYGNVAAVRGLNLEVRSGEILAVIGPSGCGKTTLLRLIAGFERPEMGTIVIGGRHVSGAGQFVAPEHRQVGMVFQNYALFPHLTVAENVAYGLHARPRAAREQQVQHILRLVNLSELAGRLPHQLSGGQQQRVALARALAPEPVLVLLDEPFSSLDADLRAQVREEVRAMLRLRGVNVAAIFVTHDQEEALFMGDRVAVMNAGRLEQVGTPEELFSAPATRFVAEFMGHTDFLPGEVTAEGILTEVGLVPQRLALPLGTPVELAVRADDVVLQRDRASKALILGRHFQGIQNLYRVRLPSGRLLHSLQPHTLLWPPGTPVRVLPEAGHNLACFHEGRLVKTLE